jgi:hypothetical protein
LRGRIFGRPSMSPSTRLRSAVNRQLFLREVNNKLLDMYGILEILSGETKEFICECAAPECIERIVVSLPDYAGCEAIR